MSVWGSEDLLKGKECTKRAEAGRSGNKPLLTHFYGLEKRVLVIPMLMNKLKFETFLPQFSIDLQITCNGKFSVLFIMQAM